MVGKTISHYRILEKIGEGGMGAVYKAEDTKLHRIVALKFIRSEAVEDRELKARFRNEAEAAAALIHPNICVVHEIDEADGISFIAMEYVDGESLAEKVKKRPLPLEEALDIALQVAEGLQAAHEKGIVHRDVKPDNVLLTGRGQAKIMDFGLARLAGGTSLTKAGTVLGTPAYMSPEQVQGEETDGRTDIWSLGVVLYEMVTGRLPFRGETAQSVALTIQNQEPEPLTAVRTGVPVELDRIVSKALAKSPAERYQHVDELLVDLRRCRTPVKSGESWIRPPQPTSFLAKRRWLFTTLAAMVAVVIGGAWYFLQQGSVSHPAQVSIAVLPLRMLSADALPQEYLSSGLTEELITDLAQISSLSVTAHTSVLRFKETLLPIPEIARMLKVDYIVEGSLVRVGNSLRITAQLIEAATDHHLWARSYEREVEDVLRLQDEVARAIAREVRVKLTPEESRLFARTGRVNPKAYEAYLKGRSTRLDGEPTKAFSLLSDAIAEDPSFAPAYAALASSYIDALTRGSESGRNLIPIARAAAIRAIEFDPNLAEAHAALAVTESLGWNWQQAEREFQRAFELNPGVADVHSGYAWHWLTPQGKLDEAITHAERGVELDPLLPARRVVLAIMRNMGGQRERATEDLESVLNNVSSPAASLTISVLYAEAGRCEEAIAAVQKGRLYGTLCVPCGAVIRATCGRREEAEKLLLEAERTTVVSSSPAWGAEEWPAVTCCLYAYGTPATMAKGYAALGNKDKAFEWLEAAYRESDIWMQYLKVDPVWNPLRSDPRYARLLRRMNLEP